MKRLLNLWPRAAMVVMGILWLPHMGIAQERHPQIRAAIDELREARQELATAARDFCGHGRDAVHECDEALSSTEAGAGLRSPIEG